MCNNNDFYCLFIFKQKTAYEIFTCHVGSEIFIRDSCYTTVSSCKSCAEIPAAQKAIAPAWSGSIGLLCSSCVRLGLLAGMRWHQVLPQTLSCCSVTNVLCCWGLGSRTWQEAADRGLTTDVVGGGHLPIMCPLMTSWDHVKGHFPEREREREILLLLQSPKPHLFWTLTLTNQRSAEFFCKKGCH